MRTLLRDVGVNVLANLIAAAVIYLLSAFVEILPRSPLLIAISAAILSVPLLIGIASLVRSDDSLVVGLTLAVAVVAMGVPFVLFASGMDQETAGPAFALSFTVAAIFGLAAYLTITEKRAKRRGRGRDKQAGSRREEGEDPAAGPPDTGAV